MLDVIAFCKKKRKKRDLFGVAVLIRAIVWAAVVTEQATMHIKMAIVCQRACQVQVHGVSADTLHGSS